MIDVVEFGLGQELYAMDIQLAREIVEMMPITHIPRAQDYIAGIMNLRGEITTVIDLKRLIQIPGVSGDNQKIIVLVAEATGGSNLGIIVDDVHSVIQVAEDDIELMDEGIASGVHAFVKGIIKLARDEDDRKQADGRPGSSSGSISKRYSTTSSGTAGHRRPFGAPAKRGVLAILSFFDPTVPPVVGGCGTGNPWRSPSPAQRSPGFFPWS